MLMIQKWFILVGQLLHFHTKIHTYTVDKFIHGCHDDDPLFGFSGGSDSIKSSFNAGHLGLIPGTRRSPGEGNCNLRQYFCLENSWAEEPGRATVHGVTKSQTQWSANTHTNGSGIS